MEQLKSTACESEMTQLRERVSHYKACASQSEDDLRQAL